MWRRWYRRSRAARGSGPPRRAGSNGTRCSARCRQRGWCSGRRCPRDRGRMNTKTSCLHEAGWICLARRKPSRAAAPGRCGVGAGPDEVVEGKLQGRAERNAPHVLGYQVGRHRHVGNSSRRRVDVTVAAQRPVGELIGRLTGKSIEASACKPAVSGVASIICWARAGRHRQHGSPTVPRLPTVPQLPRRARAGGRLSAVMEKTPSRRRSGAKRWAVDSRVSARLTAALYGR